MANLSDILKPVDFGYGSKEDQKPKFEYGKHLAYPLELKRHESTDGVAYMLFFINTDTRGSTLEKDRKIGVVDISQENRSQFGLSDIKKDTIVAQNANVRVESKDSDKDIQSQIKEQKEGKQGKFSKNLSRIDRTIALPMPQVITVNGEVAYRDIETSNVDNFYELIKDNGLFDNKTKQALSDIGMAALGNIGQRKFNGGAIGNLIGEYALSTRVAFNPRKEQLFDSVQFRTFNFIYNFAAKSAKEAEEINNIIKTFRYYQLPELRAEGIYYYLPAEFQMKFMIGSKENDNLIKISTCGLASCVISYNNQGQGWTNFVDGNPVQIEMQLQFRELELLDRGRIYNADKPRESGY